MDSKRVLIVSNTSLSQETSNGRTLSNLLQAFHPSRLAQFYIHGTPDYAVCSGYYSVSDKEALNAFCLKKQKKKSSAENVAAKSYAHDVPDTLKTPQPVAAAGTKTSISAQNQIKEPAPPKAAQEKVVRSCKNLVLRDFVWMSYRWWDKDFTKFIDDFRPEVVLLQAGDSPFMFAIARKIAKKYQAKLTMFNTENYVLKEVLYSGAKKNDIWHRILRHRLRAQYRRFMKKADYCTYNTEWLEAAYQEAYPHPGKSSTFYVSTELKPVEHAPEDSYVITYCGNLGVGRTAPLLTIAKVMQQSVPEAKLHIYGKFPSAKEQSRFLSLPNVECHGTVPYTQVPGILSASTMVLHCENPKRVENLKYAFSTKIADSLACGRPFLVYASQEYPFVRYLAEHDCAHIASTPEQLAELLAKCRDRDYCDKPLQNAQTLALENHATDVNSQRMHSILCSL